MYRLTNTSAIIRLTDIAFIPADRDNNDYAEYERWVKAGNTPLPADVPLWAPIKEAELLAMRATFEKMINRLMGIAARLGRAGDASGALTCDRAAEALVALHTTTAILAAGNLIALQAAFRSEYDKAAALLSPAASTAFRSMGR